MSHSPASGSQMPSPQPWIGSQTSPTRLWSSSVLLGLKVVGQLSIGSGMPSPSVSLDGCELLELQPVKPQNTNGKIQRKRITPLLGKLLFIRCFLNDPPSRNRIMDILTFLPSN